jgi:chromosome partitioning protein
MASTDVIVPVHGHCPGVKGLRRLLESIRIIRERLQSQSAEHIHLLLTFVDDRGAFGRQVQQQVRDAFGRLVLGTMIHRNISLAEAPGAGKPVLTYAPRSRGAADYKALAREILQESGLPGEQPAMNTSAQRRGPMRLIDRSDVAREPEAELPGSPPELGGFEST